MKLIGNYLSPYVRRVAVSLHAVGLPFELERVFVFQSPDEVRKRNPLVRIPTLVLDSGDALVESYAILDEIDQMAGRDRRLVPAAGSARRHVMKATAIGVGTMEKAQWSFYERRFRPAEKVHEPWIQHNDAQVLGGLGYLEELAGNIGADGWLAGTDTMSQADITGVVAFSFVEVVRPALKPADTFPKLAAFARRCEALDSFLIAPVPALDEIAAK